MKNKIFLYYVEGEDEKKLLEVLKTDRVIEAGKVQVLNVIQKMISNTRLMSLQPNTTVVLVYDTDTDNIGVLEKNIATLNKCHYVSAIYTIPQVKNLEDELIRSCNIKDIKELLGSKSAKDFKGDLIRVSNLPQKLRKHNFDITKFWNCVADKPFDKYANNAINVKCKE